MTQTNQSIETIIREHRRRLQILKQRKAQLGITTPPEVLTEIEDIESQLEELQQTQKIDDPFLA
jgi:predicted  nucleic acid-binding Zn-ribbon protein